MPFELIQALITNRDWVLLIPFSLKNRQKTFKSHKRRQTICAQNYQVYQSLCEKLKALKQSSEDLFLDKL